MSDQDPTKGDSPILDDAPTVTIAGEVYQLRRLGVRDTFAIARIVAVGAVMGTTTLRCVRTCPSGL